MTDIWDYDAELEGWNPSTAAVETIHVTDGAGLLTRAGDDPANTWLLPVLRLPTGEIHRRQIFRDGLTGGVAEMTIGEVELLNLDGSLDYLLDWGFDTRAFRLYRRAAGAAVGTRTLILTLAIEQLLPARRAGAGIAESRLTVRLKDPMSRFDVPLQPAKYAGTNVGAAGLEGTEDDLAGRPKPVLYGRAYNVPALPANTSELIDQVADGPVAEISEVYDAGVPLALDGDDTSVADLVASSPGAGEFRTHLAGGYLKRGSVAEGAITADVATVAAPLPSGDAVDLDGTDDEYLRADAFAGGGDSERGLLSLWLRIDGGDGTRRQLVRFGLDSDQPLNLCLNTDDEIECVWKDAAGATRGTMTSTGTLSAGAGWHHLLLAWDFAVPTARLHVDDGNETSLVSGAGTVLRLGSPNRVGAKFGAPNDAFPGALAELWIGWGQYLDLSVEANRRRFRTSAGYPANLGPTGSRPTGISPLVYLRGGPEAFGINLGTGGDFTVVSAPTVADSTPYAAAPSVPATVTAPEIIRAIATERVGLVEAEIDQDAFDAASIAAPEDVGLWEADPVSCRQAIDVVAASAGLGVWITSVGLLALARRALPAGAPTVWLDDDDLIELREVPGREEGKGIPAYSIVVEHSLNHTVQKGGDLAGSVTAARRAFLEQEYRTAPLAPDNTVRAKHRGSPELTFRTTITNETDALAFAGEQLAIERTRRPRFEARVHLTETTRALDLMDRVGLRRNRFGLASGKVFRLFGHGLAPRPGGGAPFVSLDLALGENPAIQPALLHVLTIHPPAILTGVQTIVIGANVDILQLHTPAAVQARYTIAAADLGDRLSLLTPAAVSVVYTIQAADLGNRLAILTPASVTARATIAPALLAPLAIHQPAVQARYSVAAADLGNRLTIHDPAVTALATIVPQAPANRLTIHAPGLVFDQTIQADDLGNRVAIHLAVVQSGATFIAAASLGNRITIHQPAIAALATIAADPLAPLAIHQPAAVATYTIAADDLGDRLAIHTPTAVTALATIVPQAPANRLTLHLPTIVPEQIVAAADLGNRVSIHQPALAAAYAIAAASLGNRITIHQPAIFAGDGLTTEDGDLLTTEAGDVINLE